MEGNQVQMGLLGSEFDEICRDKVNLPVLISYWVNYPVLWEGKWFYAYTLESWGEAPGNEMGMTSNPVSKPDDDPFLKGVIKESMGSVIGTGIMDSNVLKARIINESTIEVKRIGLAGEGTWIRFKYLGQGEFEKLED